MSSGLDVGHFVFMIMMFVVMGMFVVSMFVIVGMVVMIMAMIMRMPIVLMVVSMRMSGMIRLFVIVIMVIISTTMTGVDGIAGKRKAGSIPKQPQAENQHHQTRKQT